MCSAPVDEDCFPAENPPVSSGAWFAYNNEIEHTARRRV